MAFYYWYEDHGQNQHWAGKELFQVTMIVHHEEVRAELGDRNPEEAGAESKVIEECCILSCPVHRLLSLLSYTTQDQFPRGSTTHSGFWTTASNINQGNVPHTNLMEGYSQFWFLFLGMSNFVSLWQKSKPIQRLMQTPNLLFKNKIHTILKICNELRKLSSLKVLGTMEEDKQVCMVGFYED